jgi:glutathione S-transferase
MLKIYHVTGTRSVRTLWLVKELGLAHQVVAMPFDHKVMHGPEYLRINPLGKVPAIDDEGFVLTESGAITQYLLAKFGGGRLELSPKPQAGSPEHGRFLQWLHFPEATMMPQLGILVRQRRAAEDRRDPHTVDHAVGKATEMLAFSNAALQSATYILGPDFTAADIMLGYRACWD